MNLSVKNVKTFTGREGHGFNCVLYIDGVRSALVSDYADGGEAHFDWLNKRKQEEFEAHVKTLPNTFPDDPEIAKLIPEGLPQDETSVVWRLIDEVESIKEQKRWCRNKTIFRLPGDPKGEFRTVESPYAPGVKHFLIGKYGESVEIINEKFLR